MDSPIHPHPFQTTRWSQVVAASDANDPARCRDSLQLLCQTYWPPLYSFLRRSGYHDAEAQDATQAFFARVIEGNLLQYADQQRGRFRSFLLASLKQFLARQHRDDHTLKRRPPVIKSLDEATAAQHWVTDESLSPESAFDRHWAEVVIQRVVCQLRQEYQERDKEALFDLLQVYLRELEPKLTYAEIADRLQSTEGAVRVAVHRLRRRCGELVRQEIGQTVASGQDLDDEIRYLAKLLTL